VLHQRIGLYDEFCNALEALLEFILLHQLLAREFSPAGNAFLVPDLSQYVSCIHQL